LVVSNGGKGVASDGKALAMMTIDDRGMASDRKGMASNGKAMPMMSNAARP
jgi:hypothetical protein